MDSSCSLVNKSCLVGVCVCVYMSRLLWSLGCNDDLVSPPPLLPSLSPRSSWIFILTNEPQEESARTTRREWFDADDTCESAVKSRLRCGREGVATFLTITRFFPRKTAKTSVRKTYTRRFTLCSKNVLRIDRCFGNLFGFEPNVNNVLTLRMTPFRGKIEFRCR